ncbi:MAG: PH domain-containing protein [Acidobacteria bacterium]|nr:PH domain-containing protein [Acidobacteriota bacterium]
MLERLEGKLLEWLRVPPEPHPPAGSAGSLRMFRASPRYLRYLQLGWLWRQGALVVGFFTAAAFTAHVLGEGQWEADDFVRAVEGSSDAPPVVVKLLRGIHGAAIRFFVDGGFDTMVLAFLLLQAPLTFAMTGLAYRQRWYMTTDRSLRIREGVWDVREQTMTFSNVQNVEIRQGPLQRLFGIADLEVRSAGGGAKRGNSAKKGREDDNLHVARFKGVDNAAEIREAIRSQLDKPPAEAPRGTSDVAAAHELLAESRALRRALQEPV